MIFDVIDYYTLFKISRLIDSGEFKDIDFTSQTFFQYLIDNWDKDKIKVFVNTENGQINAFVICSLSQDVVTRRPEVFIDLAWVKKGIDGQIGIKLLDKVVSYAKTLNLSRISGFTLRGQEKAMFAKYGFRPYSTIMIKDINVAISGQKGIEKDKATIHREKSREFYEKNREKILLKRKEYYKQKKQKKIKNLQKMEVKNNGIKETQNRT